MGKLTKDKWQRSRHQTRHAPSASRARPCDRCGHCAGALYTVWAADTSFEDRIYLCGLCLDEHNRRADWLRGLRVAQGREAFEAPTLRGMVHAQAAVAQAEAALALQKDGAR